MASLTSELLETGSGCSFVPMDLTEEGNAQELVYTTVEHMGRLDILVNAKGINRPQKAEEVTYKTGMQ